MPQVTLICHLQNLGTSGAATTAFEYAVSKNYDWLWVMDQDSIPQNDALEKQMDLYHRFDPKLQSQIGVLGSLVFVHPSQDLSVLHLLTRRGTKLIKVNRNDDLCECDTTIWSGSLYNLKAVEQVGLPRYGVGGYWDDFCLDWGDLEFGYRIKRAGYKVIVNPKSIVYHNIGKVTHVTLLGRKLFTSNHLPFRRYLSFRNMVYFWIYLHPDRHLLPVVFF